MTTLYPKKKLSESQVRERLLKGQELACTFVFTKEDIPYSGWATIQRRQDQFLVQLIWDREGGWNFDECEMEEDSWFVSLDEALDYLIAAVPVAMTIEDLSVIKGSITRLPPLK